MCLSARQKLFFIHFQAVVYCCRAVAIPGGDATGQDALDGAAVELLKVLGTHAKSFQPPEGEGVVVSSSRLSWSVRTMIVHW